MKREFDIHKKPFFTIIIPTYNAGKTLQRAVKSVFSQKYTNYEVLVIDGKSTDNTISIVSTFQQHSNKIRCYSDKDLGIYDAINKGLTYSEGTFVYVLGADDYLIDPYILEKVQGILVESSIDVLYGNVVSPVLGKKYDGEFTSKILMSKNICHQAIFIKKMIFERIGNFDITYKVHADWAHNLKWFNDPKINKKHIDLTIAFYEGDGLSAHLKDRVFRKDFVRIVYNAAIKSHNIFEIGLGLMQAFIIKTTKR